MKQPPAGIPERLIEDILEQQSVWKSVLDRVPEELGHLTFPSSETLCLVGIAEGSSRHALLIAQPFIEAWTDVPLRLFRPDFLHSQMTIMADTMSNRGLFHDSYFLVVSQSGETASLIHALSELKSHFLHSQNINEHPFFSLTNNPNSTLAKSTSNHLTMGAGHEQYIAATKTLTASVLQLLLWGLAWARQLERMSDTQVDAMIARLRDLPNRLEYLVARKRPLTRILKWTEKLKEVNHFIILSKGPVTQALPEAGLKLIETSSNIVYTDNTESFKHGPKVMLSGIQEVHPNTIYIIPTGNRWGDNIYEDIKKHFGTNPNHEGFPTDRVFIIRFENSPPIPDEIRTLLKFQDDQELVLPKVHGEFENVFMTLVIFQLISFFLAWHKGESPDNPALQKAVVD